MKRDLYQSKKTQINQKRPQVFKCKPRPALLRRDPYQSKETYMNDQRPTSITRDLHQQKETYCLLELQTCAHWLFGTCAHDYI